MIKNIKDAVWQRKHPKKKATLQSFGKKTKTTKIFLIQMKDLGDELVIVVIAVYLSFPKRWLSVKKFFLQRIVKERWQ